MRKLSTIALATVSLFMAAAVPATAETLDSQTFERDGVTYTYTVKQVAGKTLIRGISNPGSKTFSLRVSDGRVSGHVDNQSVSFRLSEGEMMALESGTTLSMR